MTSILIAKRMKKQRDADVDKKIDAALAVGLEHKQDPAQMRFIDVVVRPAMKWINDMEAEGMDVGLVENAICGGLASILGEITLRTNRRDDLVGGQEFAQRQINRLSAYLVDSLNLNFHAPANKGN